MASFDAYSKGSKAIGLVSGKTGQGTIKMGLKNQVDNVNEIYNISKPTTPSLEKIKSIQINTLQVETAHIINNQPSRRNNNSPRIL